MRQQPATNVDGQWLGIGTGEKSHRNHSVRDGCRKLFGCAEQFKDFIGSHRVATALVFSECLAQVGLKASCLIIPQKLTNSLKIHLMSNRVPNLALDLLNQQVTPSIQIFQSRDQALLCHRTGFRQQRRLYGPSEHGEMLQYLALQRRKCCKSSLDQHCGHRTATGAFHQCLNILMLDG